MLVSRASHYAFISLTTLGLGLGGCAKATGVSAKTGNAAYCPSEPKTTAIAGTTGNGKIFQLDPLVASGNASLSPGSSSLKNYTSTVTLSNLLGYGTLKGNYVDVLTGRCDESYGAFSISNDFRYDHGDDRFAEVMNYYYGNKFRSDLASSSVLYPTGSFTMIANCDVADNAYYSQGYSQGVLVPFVCMGRSSNYPTTTSFSEDASVMVHELQHGTTAAAYSAIEDFNKLDYDEAGAINEAISDFIGLIQTEADVVSPFRSFEFSRWALGLLFGQSMMRGAAKCPVWTADYPTCSNFSKTTSGFSESAKRISFAYPDGLGWPYAGPPSASTLEAVWKSSYGFEEIHQTAPVIAGALWDIYEAIKTSSGNATLTRQRIQRLLIETIKTLPKASASDPSPVTMPVLATKLNAMAALTTAGTFSGAEQPAISNALAARGLTSIPVVADGRATNGGNIVGGHTGVAFSETKAVGAANNRMHAGETGGIWFDIKNTDANTAAAPLLKVTSSDSRVKFSGRKLNSGYVSDTVAFVRYGKINGTGIVAQMNNGGGGTGITNTYFGVSGTQLYGVNAETALYIEIAAGTPVGTALTFTVEITPANKTSVPSTLTFPVTLQ